MTQLIAFIILLDGRKEWTPELYGEMAELFSSISNVESADVPVALKVYYLKLFGAFNNQKVTKSSYFVFVGTSEGDFRKQRCQGFRQKLTGSSNFMA